MLSLPHTPGLALCMLLAASAAGCVVDVGASGSVTAPPSRGTVTLLSSIEGSTDPTWCADVGASDLELAVYDGPDLYTVVSSPCESFALTVELPEGSYSGDATLLDVYARPVSTTLTLDDLRVIAGTDLQVAVDFPSSSLLP